MNVIQPTREFAEYITPEKAKEFNDKFKGNTKYPLSYWEHRASINQYCSVCEAEPVWRFGQTDLCFSCCTGESDPSDDYELEYKPRGGERNV